MAQRKSGYARKRDEYETQSRLVLLEHWPFGTGNDRVRDGGKAQCAGRRFGLCCVRD